VRENTVLRTKLGTREFLAPEVAIVNCEEYSNKVDLWSLGCVIFKSLTQTLPFPSYESLQLFCSGGAFPMGPLDAKKITPEGVSFLKTLLVVGPEDRLTAGEALDVEWLQISDEDSTIRAHKNSLPQTNDQTSDITELPSRQDLNKSSTNRAALTLKNSGSQINNRKSEDMNVSPTNRMTLPLRPEDGKTPIGLQIALHTDIVSERAIQDAHTTQLLQENGFDINAVDFDANIALLWAASEDQTGHTIQLLLRKEADIAAKDDGGRTALHWAADKGHEAVVRLLLEKGVSFKGRDSNG
jgi:ankyrin repeat protein